jgi:hypothetical protein
MRSKQRHLLAHACLCLCLAGLPLTGVAAACGAFDFCTDPWTISPLQGFANSAVEESQFVYQITPNNGWQDGSIWNPNTLDLTQPFNFYFSMNFGTNPTLGSGGDGMCFVLQPTGTAVCGSPGGDLGVDNLNWSQGPNAVISPSLVVEFDTFVNSAANLPNTNDPSYAHIMVDEDGNVAHVATNSCALPALANGGTVTSLNGTCPPQAVVGQTNISDGNWHDVVMNWTGASGSPANTLTVYFGTFGGAAPVPVLSYTNNNIVAMLGTNCVYVGFTGGTGGASNLQQVRLQECLPSPTPSPTDTESPTPYPTACGAIPDEVQSAVLANGCSGNGNPFNFSYTIPNDPGMVLIAQVESTGPTLSGVTWNGVALTALPGNPVAVNAGGDIWTYYLVNPVSGTFMLDYNATTGCSWNAVATLYENVDTSNPIGQVSTTQGSASIVADTITTLNPHSIIHDLFAYPSGPTTFTGLTGVQLFATSESGCCNDVFGSSLSTAAPGSYSLDYNAGGNKQWTGQSIELNAVPATCNSPTPVPTATISPIPNSPTPTYTRTVSPSVTVTPSITNTFTQSETLTPVPPALLLTPHDPNPDPATGGSVWLPYTINAAADVSITIFDVAGEQVRTFSQDPEYNTVGDHERQWDLMNTSGQGVASGVFLARIVAKAGNVTQTVWEKCAVAR